MKYAIGFWTKDGYIDCGFRKTTPEEDGEDEIMMQEFKEALELQAIKAEIEISEFDKGGKFSFKADGSTFRIMPDGSEKMITWPS